MNEWVTFRAHKDTSTSCVEFVNEYEGKTVNININADRIVILFHLMPLNFSNFL